MVKGLDTFKQFFNGFEENYVIIGETACEIHEEIYAQTPRATKDIDIILVVEALSSDFVSKFWDFVKAGDYTHRNKGVNICLKSKAFLDLTQRRSKGENVDLKHIAKHKKDVFRLAAMLTPASRYDLPETLRANVACFCNTVSADLPNGDFIKAAGIGKVTSEQIIAQLRQSML